ncbi:MAG: hypothetical protein H6662_08295 [Ardenticatenaceae bacterium]|nr:hypothetical protein [Anaerolineales bacterium]MCB8921566.1 hypothetical protein [Ardenticatenaceae bacterium]MCB9003897.1 hypothetical protein [Ardenticatenaceae bacterium]
MILIAVGTAVYIHYHAYLSPGPLSAVNHTGEELGGFTSHAMFEQECSFCHAPVHCITDNRCQECHMDIAQQRAEAMGLHSLLPGTEQCQSCHVEHQGREAVISRVVFKNINHEGISGFSLAQHETRFDGTPMVCEDCHTEGRFAADEVNCVDCHTAAGEEMIAEHRVEHGENCRGCHDGQDSIVDFDHDAVYVLAQGHENVGCADCHAEQVFAGTPQTCESCHEEPDVHAGQFGQDCARCHTAVAWAPAQLTQHQFMLNHGDGETLACTSCHVTSYAEVTCEECHTTADMIAAHPAEKSPDFTLGQPCASCHSTGQPEDTMPLAHAQ